MAWSAAATPRPTTTTATASSRCCRAATAPTKRPCASTCFKYPGIQDIVFTRLAGTFDCYVYGISPSPSPSLLDAVQQTINNNVAFPLTGTAIAPDLVGISLVTTLTTGSSLSSTDQGMVVSNAVTAAQEYIDNLGVGEQLVINAIADRIFSSDSRIVDVGQPNKQIPEIFIWRARPDGSRYSRSKVKESFISCFIISQTLILVSCLI